MLHRAKKTSTSGSFAKCLKTNGRPEVIRTGIFVRIMSFWEHNSWIRISFSRVNMQYRDGILFSKVHVGCGNNAYIATGTIGTLRWTFVEIE